LERAGAVPECVRLELRRRTMEAIKKMISAGRGQSAFELLHASGKLPSPKGVATRVIRLTRQEEVSLAELARVIGGDPAFVGRVIKAANGMVSRGRRPVVSVSEALMILGIPAIRALATGFSLLSEHRKGGCEAFDYERYWSYSIALALGMQAIVEHTRAAASDEAFSLGLLLRVGELALATAYPSEYAEVLNSIDGDGSDLLEPECATFAIHHCDLGAEMLENWGVPKFFTQIAQHFDATERPVFDAGSRQEKLFDSMMLAKSFASFCLAPEGERLYALESIVEAGGVVGVQRDDMIADASRMFTLWTEWIAMLKLDPRVSRRFPDIDVPVDAGVERPSAIEGVRIKSERQRERLIVAKTPDKPVVLVVDADGANRRRVARLLASEDCALVETGDVSGALDFTLELQPHMMILGCADASAEVLDTVTTLRRTSVGRIMYLLLRVHEANDDTLVALLEAGGDDAVPMDSAERLLLARLRAGLREVRLQRELEHDRQELHGFAAQLAITNRRLHDMALTDPLTGLRNRRYAMDRMEQEWSGADRSGRPLSCMVIDLDELKEINDTLGHDAGDTALCRVAQALRKSLRVQDVLCRVGGDEFLVICPGAALGSAMACAERARKGVEEVMPDVGGRQVVLGVSIGVAEKRAGVSDAGELIKLADRGAYLAKKNGRNAVYTVLDQS
jgi:two-component system cell cycle response regulator